VLYVFTRSNMHTYDAECLRVYTGKNIATDLHGRVLILTCEKLLEVFLVKYFGLFQSRHGR